MLVKDAMTSKAEWVSPSISVREIAQKMKAKNIGCMPVGENDRVIGMITDRDIACRAVANGGDMNKLTARDVMSKGLVYCFDDQDLGAAARLMNEKQVHHLPVMNREKRMVGMLALGDIANKGSKDVLATITPVVARDAARNNPAKAP